MPKNERAAAIADHIANHGITVYEYRGVPASYKAWEQRLLSKRFSNQEPSRMKTGHRPHPKRDQAIIRANS